MTIFIYLFLWTGRALATSFSPECSPPPPGSTFVSGPNMRSTLDIFWNCMSIIILCTWTIQHLNVPGIRSPPKNCWQSAWWIILDAKSQFKWMMATILVPEYLVGKALGEWLAAYSSVKETTAKNRAPSHGWQMVHAYMANMGYFVLDTADPALSRDPAVTETKCVHCEADATGAPLNPTSSQAASLESAISDYTSESHKINLARLQTRYWALTSQEWDRAVSLGLASYPNVPAHQLEKLDRGGVLLKALALIQVTYMVVQLVARKVAGLPSAQLEVASLAFSGSSFITYLLYWNRPQGVETIHVVKANFSGASRENTQQGASEREAWLASIKNRIASSGPLYLWLGSRIKANFDPTLGPYPIPNDASPYSSTLYNLVGYNEELASIAFGAVFGGVIFGGLHCLAWDFEFPTSGELIAWRVCSILCTALPVGAIAPMYMWIRMNPWRGEVKRGSVRTIVALVVLIGFVIPYLLARIFLMVEVFRTLFFLPPEAFTDTWSGMFPHWG